MAGESKVHVFSPLFISKEDPAERQEEIARLRNFLQEIGEEINKGVFDGFLLVDDGSDPEVRQELERLRNRFPWLRTQSNPDNLGLCRTLWQTYQLFMGNGPDDVLVRLDSDGEHDPKMIKELIDKVRSGCDAAICQIRYRPEHQSDADRMFNTFAGSMQGSVIFGRGERLTHNCPGFSAYRAGVISAIKDDYVDYAGRYRKRFGEEHNCFFEIVLMFLATRKGFSIDRTAFHDSRIVAPNRGPDKILSQSVASANNLLLMLELDPVRKKELGG